MTLSQIILVACIGLLAGVACGMFGIGGGIVVVPALVIFMGMSQHEAQGTSIGFMLLPIGILAAMNYYKAGYINITYSVILAVTFVLGGYLGSLITIQWVPDNLLRKIFGIVMIIVAAKMIFSK